MACQDAEFQDELTHDLSLGVTYRCRYKVTCFKHRAYIYPCTRIVLVLVITTTYHLLYIMLSVDYILFYNIKVYL